MHNQQPSLYAFNFLGYALHLKSVHTWNHLNNLKKKKEKRKCAYATFDFRLNYWDCVFEDEKKFAKYSEIFWSVKWSMIRIIQSFSQSTDSWSKPQFTKLAAPFILSIVPISCSFLFFFPPSVSSFPSWASSEFLRHPPFLFLLFYTIPKSEQWGITQEFPSYHKTKQHKEKHTKRLRRFRKPS